MHNARTDNPAGDGRALFAATLEHTPTARTTPGSTMPTRPLNALQQRVLESVAPFPHGVDPTLYRPVDRSALWALYRLGMIERDHRDRYRLTAVGRRYLDALAVPR